MMTENKPDSADLYKSGIYLLMDTITAESC